MKLFIPKKIYYEEDSLNYFLGKELIDKYKNMNIPMEIISSHNNIESLRKEPNSSFVKLKQYLIIGTRKTHKYTDNHKVSDFLVPYTSSGCSAMCLYCYLVCNYNKCSYMRLFVNREQMMEKLIKKASSFEDEKVFEIGSNSDLILENELTHNLEWTINEFTKQKKGKLTFPTKFDMVEPILNLNHDGRVIARISLNPQHIIQKAEIGTSSLKNRIEAINKLCEAGYPVGILVAPVIFLEDWEKLYTELFEEMASSLSEKAKKNVFFEVIFMTYSYIHDKINNDAFPNTINIFDKNLMTGRGRGKYWYKQFIRDKGEQFFRDKFKYYFPNNEILYIV